MVVGSFPGRQRHSRCDPTCLRVTVSPPINEAGTTSILMFCSYQHMFGRWQLSYQNAVVPQVRQSHEDFALSSTLKARSAYTTRHTLGSDSQQSGAPATFLYNKHAVALDHQPCACLQFACAQLGRTQVILGQNPGFNPAPQLREAQTLHVKFLSKAK